MRRSYKLVLGTYDGATCSVVSGRAADFQALITAFFTAGARSKRHYE
jgi:hypothetical protein